MEEVEHSMNKENVFPSAYIGINNKEFKEELILERKLIEQKKLLQELIKRSDKKILKYKDLPKTTIYLSSSRGSSQYYIVNPDSGERKYISKGEKKLIRSAFQRDYDYKVNAKLHDMDKALDKFLKKYSIKNITNEYDKLADGRKDLITPIIESDEQFISS